MWFDLYTVFIQTVVRFYLGCNVILNVRYIFTDCSVILFARCVYTGCSAGPLVHCLSKL